MRSACSLILFVFLFGLYGAETASAHVKWGDHKQQRHHVANRAKNRLGARYCWGGTGGCYDCSGFTYRVFKDHGATLPHNSTRQWNTRHRKNWRTVWKRHKLKKGDLVFFANTYKPGISHAGVYIGDGKFVHASSSGRGVRKDDLTTGYYRRHFHAGVRPSALRAPSSRN